VNNLSSIFNFSGISLGFSGAGGISNLVDNSNGRIWAKDSKRVAEYMYITLSAQDYTDWLEAYTPCSDIYKAPCDWVLSAHGKYNVSEAKPQHIKFSPQLQKLWTKQISPSQQEFLLFMTLDPQANKLYGGPLTLWTSLSVSVNAQRTISVNVTLSWWSKEPTRLPESHWFSFNPVVGNPPSWQMDKLGHLVSPLNVGINGSQNLHGINPVSGVFYQSDDGRVSLKSLDIPMVSPGNPTALPSVVNPPDVSQGFHFLLTANIWGTNWPEWYPFAVGDENSMFRFEVQMSPQ